LIDGESSEDCGLTGAQRVP